MEKNKKARLYVLITEGIGAESEEITDKSEFLADLNATPGEVAELVKRVEDEFDIEIEVSLEDLVTVTDLIQAIEEAEL